MITDDTSKNVDRFDESIHMFMDDWRELMITVESMDIDMRKHIARNNRAAGLRVRRGLRLIKASVHDLLMRSLERDKQEIEKRQAKRAKKHAKQTT